MLIFIFYGLPIWAFVNILLTTDEFVPRLVVCFTSVVYFLCNFVLICFIGVKGNEERNRLARIYLFCFMYSLIGAIACKTAHYSALIVITTIGPQ